ncbi:MAG: hypothetical protein JWM44_4495 [Bacilli bacterium]|nr:hypothetical protein [Bacilli bacterium]
MQSHVPIIPQKTADSGQSAQQTSPSITTTEPLQLQNALADPTLPLSQSHILQLQKTIGNQGVAQLLKSRLQPVQRSDKWIPINGNGSIQRRIAQNATTWLDGTAANKQWIKSYYNSFFLNEYKRLLEVTENPRADLYWEIKELYEVFLPIYNNALFTNDNWDEVVTLLDALVRKINEDFDEIEDSSRYSNVAEDSWENPKAALTAVSAINFIAAPAGPSALNMPDIHGINLSDAIAVFPAALIRQMKDIYAAWENSSFIDERTEAEVGGGTITSKIPGSLRSWHTNVQGSLPTAPGGATPAKAQPLEDHYTATSGAGAAIVAAGPVGYAEYTGTGIMNDIHNSKIVFDYKQGHVFLTLTHYKLWSQEDNGPSIKDKTAGSGTESAWYYINMGG